MLLYGEAREKTFTFAKQAVEIGIVAHRSDLTKRSGSAGAQSSDPALAL
jgi:hypothetical protein